MTKPKAYKTKPRKPYIENPNPIPRWRKALGRSSGSMQGVAGWRTEYHRVNDSTRDSGDFLAEYLESLKH